MAVRRAAGRSARKKKTVQEPVRYCVYLGPSIRGVVQYGAIFHGSRDDACKQLAPYVERWPRIRSLIVDGEQLSEARIQIKTPGNGLYEQVRRLTRELAGE